MRAALYLSPHLDDAVLSCAAGILRRVEEGARVVVATLFSEGDPVRHALRRAHDEAALRQAGAEAVHVGLLDAPYRGIAQTFAGLTGTEPEGEVIDTIRASVVALAAAIEPDEIWLPTGIGGHVDHRAVFAARDVCGDRARFYADRPYAFVEPLVRLRIAELEGRAPSPSPSLAEVSQAIARASVMRAFADPHIVHARLTTPRSPTGLTITIERDDFPRSALDRVTRLVDTYATEMPSLFSATSAGQAYARFATTADGFFEERVVLESLLTADS